MNAEEDEVVKRAQRDLAKRIGVGESEIKVDSIEKADFPDAALGAPVNGEMSAQMITPGQRIRLSVGKDGYEYRASRNSLRLYKFKGGNHRVD
jgi:hypothetical protein